jgi:hypothetical protein
MVSRCLYGVKIASQAYLVPRGGKMTYFRGFTGKAALGASAGIDGHDANGDGGIGSSVLSCTGRIDEVYR